MVAPILDEALTFDDVSLVPQYSEIMSRKEPDVSIYATNKHFTENMKLEIPIISAPMNTIYSAQMHDVLWHHGGMSVTHRYLPLEDLEESLNELWPSNGDVDPYYPFFAVGATGDYMARVDLLFKNGVRKFCVDVANGFTKVGLDACRAIKDKYPDVLLMAGNICSRDGYLAMIDAGADLVRVGIGGGSICSTRVTTGFGVPQITALKQVRIAKQNLIEDGLLDEDQGTIIADGGIKNSGDIVKALVYADCVMLGSLLAGTTECPGDIIEKDGKQYKAYNGMASIQARKEYYNEEVSNYTPEGVSALVPYKGSVKTVLQNLVGGLKSGMSYCGAKTLKDLREKAVFIKVTNNGVIEASPHINRR